MTHAAGPKGFDSRNLPQNKQKDVNLIMLQIRLRSPATKSLLFVLLPLGGLASWLIIVTKSVGTIILEGKLMVGRKVKWKIRAP